jgi:hypothetical protein
MRFLLGFCSVESFADRLCITGEAPSGTIISPETILDCSGEGCAGGYPSVAWNYLISQGSPTCTSQCFAGCQPYDSGSGSSPACHHGTCDSGAQWPITYMGGSYESLTQGNGIKDIPTYQNELYNNGPLQACFTVYQNFYDFFYYTPKGIYTVASGNVVGGHCVKMIGWGTENGTDYWLFANSWDYSWGDNGYFKMERGINLCGIEGQVSEGFTKKQAQALGKSIGVQTESKFLVGGWTEQSTTIESDFTRKALNEGLRLVGEKLGREVKLSEVLSVHTQVVAGVNFRFVLLVNGGESKLAISVHRDLSNSFSLIEYHD